MAKEVLDLDPALLWVMVFTTSGEIEAAVYSKQGARPGVEEDTRKRLAILDTLFLEAYSQAEKWYGKTDYLLLAYAEAKIMLLRRRDGSSMLAAKLNRSALAEYLVPKIEKIFNA